MSQLHLKSSCSYPVKLKVCKNFDDENIAHILLKKNEKKYLLIYLFCFHVYSREIIDVLPDFTNNNNNGNVGCFSI